MFDDRQSESCARNCADIRGPMERLEQARLIDRRHPNPLIANFHPDLVRTAIELDLHRRIDRRVFQRIGQEIAEDLAQQAFIQISADRGLLIEHPVRSLHLERHLVLGLVVE